MPRLPKPSKPAYRPKIPKRKPSPDYPFYNSKRWRNYSRRFRLLCEVCEGEGRTTAAAVTDHIIPIQQGGAKWDSDNHMGMCHHHHNSKRGYEKRGYVSASQEGRDGLVPQDRQSIIDKLLKTTKTAERGQEWVCSTHPRAEDDQGEGRVTSSEV